MKTAEDGEVERLNPKAVKRCNYTSGRLERALFPPSPGSPTLQYLLHPFALSYNVSLY
jgi:hypothetical protein